MLTTPQFQEKADELVHEFTNKFTDFVVDDSEDHGNEICFFAEDGRWLKVIRLEDRPEVKLQGPFDAE